MLLKEFHEPSHVLKLVIAVVVAAAAVAILYDQLVSPCWWWWQFKGKSLSFSTNKTARHPTWGNLSPVAVDKVDIDAYEDSMLNRCLNTETWKS